MDSEASVHDLTDDRYQLIEQGPASTVSRTWSSFDGQEPQWIVAKSATTRKKFSKEPHDIIKELRILCKLSHINVISVLSHFKDTTASMLTIYLPYIPFSLAQLIASPSFSPFSPPPISALDSTQEARMLVLAKSITFQILCALAYLHDPARQITHRDIKPSNILLTPEGRVVLIDFGIAHEEATASGGHGDMWPEPAGQMYFEVSTGPYRAPELLFGTRAYDAVAIDMWSVGTVLAEMFAALRLSPDYADDDLEDEDPVCSAQPNDPPFVVPPRLHAGQPDTRWARDTLFNGRRGEIGLAWSIFKVRGTPTRESWPAFAELPGAASVEFKVVPRVPLREFLPNLPTKDEGEATRVLELLEGLLAYPPPQRLRARDALNHAWFGGKIVLPPGYVDDRTTDDERVVFELDGEVLADFVGRILS